MKCPKTFMEQVDQFIISHLQATDLIAQLAAHFQLSTSQVYRRIKRRTGLSTSMYIRQKRLEIAKKRLQQTDLSVSEIAKVVGMPPLAYFSRCYKELYGYSPSNRRMHDK